MTAKTRVLFFQFFKWRAQGNAGHSNLVLNKHELFVNCDPPSCFCTGVHSMLRVSRARGNIWFGAKHLSCNTFQDR